MRGLNKRSMNLTLIAVFNTAGILPGGGPGMNAWSWHLLSDLPGVPAPVLHVLKAMVFVVGRFLGKCDAPDTAGENCVEVTFTKHPP